MPRPARDLFIAYESIRFFKKRKVPIGTLKVYPRGDLRTNVFNQTWAASGPSQDDDRFALINILSLFRHLTVVEGVPPEVVHSEFMRIAEYADHQADAAFVRMGGLHE